MSDGELEIEQHFATVPEWVLFSGALSDAAIRLYAVIQRQGNSSGAAMPGYGWLASKMHCSKSKVARLVTELETHGALRVTRSPAVRKGDAGIVRAPNRYFLRTTDPAIGHVIPPANPSRGTPTDAPTPSSTDAPTPYRHRRTHLPPPVTPNRKKTPNTTTPNPLTNRGHPTRTETRHRKAAAAHISDEHRTAIGDLFVLTDEIVQLRRAADLPTDLWTVRNVQRAIALAIDEGQPVDLIAAAMRVMAADPASIAPNRLASAGPWWDSAARRRDDARKSAEAAARRAAITTCTACDDYGWLLPDCDTRCHHVTEQAG